MARDLVRNRPNHGRYHITNPAELGRSGSAPVLFLHPDQAEDGEITEDVLKIIAVDYANQSLVLDHGETVSFFEVGLAPDEQGRWHRFNHLEVI